MAVDINLIKELREITHAPLGDCKKALEEAQGDVKKAQEVLKQKGILKAGAKFGDRTTSTGVVRFTVVDGGVVGVKILCETDFVAKNEMFQKLVDEVLARLAKVSGDFTTETLAADKKTELQTYINEHVATIGEKLELGYVFKASGTAFAYNHTNNMLSGVVRYEGGDAAIAKDVALQVAAMNPAYVSMDDVPATEKEIKKQEFVADPALANKPEDIRAKIVDGKVHKYFQEDVLLEQASIKDQTKSVKDAIGSMKIIRILREMV